MCFKKIFSLDILFLCFCAINAQQIITTAGDSISNSSIIVNWTIGEPITETFSGSNNLLTSGFNQPQLSITTSTEEITGTVKISIYPNPTSQFINIEYFGKFPLKLEIVNLNGEVLSTEQIINNQTQIDFSGREYQVCILKFTDKTGKSNVYKVVKK